MGLFSVGIPIVGHFVNKIIGGLLQGTPMSTVVGGVVGGSLLFVGGFLLIKQAITGDEGFKTVKQIALMSLIPASLVALATVINFSQIKTALTNFFIVIRKLLYVWDFWIDVPLLISLFLASLTIFSAYWGFKAYLFVVKFFNER